MKKTILVVFLVLIANILVQAQASFPIEKQYPFIHYDKNKFLYPGDSTAFSQLFNKFDSLLIFGTGKITIVQIGASHTQADIFTARLREQMQNLYPGLNSGRGYVFPYNLIKTNSPYSYKAYHTGEWHVCRNVEHRTCLLGVTGIIATTYDTNATITIKLRNTETEKNSFNYVKILHSDDSGSFSVDMIPDSLVSLKIENRKKGYTEFYLTKDITELTLKLNKTDSLQNFFSLFGIFLENTYPGIVFHPIGINGASTSSYNKCELFTKQLQVINPDWVILALGTNDGYTSAFNESVFEANYRTLIKLIKAANPNIAITMVVPNDDYYHRRYPNPNTAKEATIMIKLAKEEGCSIWNMYEIMGGYNSSVLWLKYGLMQYDKIHFTNPGYIHLADLFFTAFVDSYGSFIYNGK